MENPEALLVWVGRPQKLHGLGVLEKNELIKHSWNVVQCHVRLLEGGAPV